MKKTYIWLVAFLLLWNTAFTQEENELLLEIYQIKVSVGHATLVVVKDKTRTYPGSIKKLVYSSTLIDAGLRGNTDGQLIVEVIKEHANSRLDRILITHLDTDHLGGLGNKTTPGILAARCSAGGEINPSLNQGRRLQLIFKEGLDEDTPKAFSGLLEIPDFLGKYKRLDWEKNLDFYLGPPGSRAWDAIQLKTLAKNGELRKVDPLSPKPPLDIGTKSGPRKNNISGVLTIVWGEFSYLVLGDLQAAKEMTFQVSRTKSDYKNVFTVPEWDERTLGIPGTQLAVTKKVTKNQDPPATLDEFIRKTLRTQDKSTKSFTDFTTDDLYKYYVASPNEWQHDLGKVIKDYNNHDKTGGNSYAHACVALVPHHGAMTSNLWFDTNHAVFGTPHNNENGHPNMQAVMATKNTSNAGNIYFTHLSDHDGFNRHAELRRLINRNDIQNTTFNILSHGEGLPSVPAPATATSTTTPTSTFSDALNGDFFLFKTEHDGKFSVSSGLKDSQTLIEIRGNAKCERDHG